MNENTKTVSFVVLALLAVGLALATRPKNEPITDDPVGRALAPDFKDPLAAKSLEIIDFDQDTGSSKQFKVAQVNGIWCLPSRYEYPADAQDQLAQAAASLVDLKILRLAGNTPDEYPSFGVVDPATAQSGATGVGKHVILSDQSGKKLIDVIIGKEVKDNSKLRYVRDAGKSPVYEVAISTDKLTTRFDNWIEKDLLKLDAWDIARIFVNSYSIDEANGRQVPGEVLDLAYNDKEGKWKLADLKEGEELDTTKLNEMKTALDDLKIVDVRKKPEGLSRDLRMEEGIQLDRATVASLVDKGFYPTQTGDLLSNEGEVVAGTNTGVQYVLRFGETAIGTEQEDQKPKDSASKDEAKPDEKVGKQKEEGKKEQGENRYLFLMAQFDEGLIPKPDLQPIPGETPAADQPKAAGEPAKTDAAPAVEAKPAETKADDKKSAEAKSNDKKPAAPAANAQKPSEGPDAPDDKAPAAKEDPTKKEPDITEADVLKADSPQDAIKDASTKAAATNGDAAKKDEGPKEAPAPEAKSKTSDEIERIKADNKRKQDEYDQKVTKGKEKVKELNDRFADWYYVISNDVYKKIHLTRADILKKPDPEKKPDSPAALDKLKEGIDAGAPAAAPEAK